MNISKRDYIYKLNDQDIKIEMSIVCFDDNRYLVILRPYMVMVYNGFATMVTHISIDFENDDKWIDQSSDEIDEKYIDPKIKKRIYAEVLLD